MNWLGLQAKLYAAGAAIVGVLAFFFRLRQVTRQRDNFKQKARQAQRAADEHREIIEADAEVEEIFSDLERRAQKDIDDEEMPGNIRNRNDF